MVPTSPVPFSHSQAVVLDLGQRPVCLVPLVEQSTWLLLPVLLLLPVFELELLL